MVEIPAVDEERKLMQDLLETTRYFPKPDIKLDKHGMPIVAPEPDDPDEADEVGWGD